MSIKTAFILFSLIYFVEATFANEVSLPSQSHPQDSATVECLIMNLLDVSSRFDPTPTELNVRGLAPGQAPWGLLVNYTGSYSGESRIGYIYRGRSDRQIILSDRPLPHDAQGYISENSIGQAQLRVMTSKRSANPLQFMIVPPEQSTPMNAQGAQFGTSELTRYISFTPAGSSTPIRARVRRVLSGGRVEVEYLSSDATTLSSPHILATQDLAGAHLDPTLRQIFERNAPERLTTESGVTIATAGEAQFVSVSLPTTNGQRQRREARVVGIRADGRVLVETVESPGSPPRNYLLNSREIADLRRSDNARQLHLAQLRNQFESDFNPNDVGPPNRPVFRYENAGQALESLRRLRANQAPREASHFWAAVDEIASHPDLMNLTWVHGSGASTLAGLRSTRGRLLPTGVLLDEGLVPFTGELQVGAVGVNQTELSGVSLRDANVALRYSQMARAGTNASNAEQLAQTFTQNLRQLNELYSSFCEDHFNPYCQAMFRSLAITVRRMRLLHSNHLQSQLTAAERSLSEFESAQPQSRDLLQTVRQELRRPLPQIQLSSLDRSLIDSNFPLIFASSSLPVRRLPKASDFAERGARQVTNARGEVHAEATLGSDIQYIFTSRDHIPEVQRWLNESGLTGVQVLSTDALDLVQSSLTGSRHFVHPAHFDNQSLLQQHLREMLEYARRSREAFPRSNP